MCIGAWTMTAIGVDRKFLNTTFTEFNITKGSSSVPDVEFWTRPCVTNLLQELIPSAHSRFRRASGKLAWMAQSRHDLKLYLSLRQAKPNQVTESAIRALLRLLFEVGTCLRLPSPEYENLSMNAKTSTSSCLSNRNKANGRKIEPVDLVRLSVLGNDG
jgi:hypothetical protein